jgi:1-acyl-sn-glycerol-3-phosphate acyltransferase
MIIDVVLTMLGLIIGILVMVVGFPLVAVCWLLDRSGKLDHYLAKWWLSSVSRILGLRVVVHGRENLRRSERYLIIANHKSAADIFVAGRVLRLHFKFFAAHHLFPMPFFGWSMSMAGYLPINRSNRRQARESIMKGTEILKRGKASLLIFPEGTRIVKPEIGDFKHGFLRIAEEARRPILPVIIEGTVKIKKKDDFWFHPGVVHVSILPAAPTDGLTPENWDETKKMYEELFRIEYKKLRNYGVGPS